jgi:peptide/nickel transport system permease protein
MLATRKGEWAARLDDLKYTLYLLRRNPLVVAGSLLSIFFIFIALTANLIVDPNLSGEFDYTIKYMWSNQALNWGSGTAIYTGPEYFFLGTDGYGRDLLKMIILAIPLDMENAFIIVIAAAAVGITIGALAGYIGGAIDEAVLRITDIFFAFPGLILALVFAAMFGRSIPTLRLAILLVWWPTYVRLMRGQVLGEKEKAYVEALRALGAGRPTTMNKIKLHTNDVLHRIVSLGRHNRILVAWIKLVDRVLGGVIDGIVTVRGHLRILFLHILPNSIYPILVQATLDFGGVILTFSALMFLGFSPSPALPELGNLASDGYLHIFEAPWVLIFPGLTILIIALAFNLVGDGLRDVLDPRLRR